MKGSRSNIYQVLGRHPVHPFPARMAPGPALEAITNLRRPATVLDPMVGSGTVLAIARAYGHRGLGFDVDPLAVLISRVWVRTLDPRDVRHHADNVIRRARQLAAYLSARDAYPVGADAETRSFVRYWFDEYARRQLTALALAIGEVHANHTREVLWCAFSRQIIAKQASVSLARDLSHSRPHRAFERGPKKPFRVFSGAVDRVIEGGVQRTSQRRGPAPTIELGDVRHIPLEGESVDLVFTSPPYLNAIDYVRCSKFSLVWMGYSVDALRTVRSTSIGSEVGSQADLMTDHVLKHLRLRPALSERTTSILRRYINDTSTALREVARVLRRRGKVIYVVGENTIRGTFIPTGRLITEVAAQAGLQLFARHARSLPSDRRYLPPPGVSGAQLDARMRREVILTFERAPVRQVRLARIKVGS